MVKLQEMDKETNDNQLHSQPASLGYVLQAARSAKALSLQDVSNNLRYSVKQVDALEKGEYHLLPDAMITRGFIRNYARLLEIDAEPLLASYRQSVASESDNLIAVRSTMRPVRLTKENQPWLKYILASILILLFLLAWLFYVDYMPKSSSVAVNQTPVVTEKAAPALTEPLPEIALPAAQRMAEDGGIAPDLIASPDTAAPAPTNVADVKQVNPLSQVEFKPLAPSVTQQIQASATSSLDKPADKTISMQFSAQTWVSITDKIGKVVYEKMSHNGDKEIINAELPLNLVIGNASGTKLNFSGKDIDLASNTKNNIARITLE